MMTALAWACGVIAALIVVAILALLFADELVRLIRGERGSHSRYLPAGCRYIVWDWFCDAMHANAVTLGKVVVIHSATLRTSHYGRTMRHEAEHCRQRLKHGRWYLLRYLWLYVRGGYTAHPMEQEARAVAFAQPDDQDGVL